MTSGAKRLEGFLGKNSFVRAHEKKWKIFSVEDQEYFPAQVILLTFSRSSEKKKNANWKQQSSAKNEELSVSVLKQGNQFKKW